MYDHKNNYHKTESFFSKEKTLQKENIFLKKELSHKNRFFESKSLDEEKFS